MTHLMNIQPDVQKVAEAISAALGVETEIVDDTLTVVAGTGKYKKRVNKKEEGGIKEAGFLYGRVVTMNHAFIVEDARNDSTYAPSVLKGETEEIADICCPIRYSDATIGVIGLIAFNSFQRKHLIQNKQQMLEFLHRMVELLASKISETQAMKQWQLATKHLHALLESIQEGILAINESGIITHCNPAAEVLIGKDREELIGQPIISIWPTAPMMDVLRTGLGYIEHEEIYPSPVNQMHFFVTATTPIMMENQIRGMVASFRHIADVGRLAYSLTNDQGTFSFSEIIARSQTI